MTPFEAVVAAKFIEQGYEVLTSGWPDFCVIKKTGDEIEVRFVEVKGRGDLLRPSQKKLHSILQVLGIEVEIIQEDAAHRMQYPPGLSAGIKVVRKHLSGRPPGARQNAILFLQNELKDGPKSLIHILQKSHEGKISRATLYRTAADMNLIRTTQGKSVFWGLPEMRQEKNNVPA